MALPQAFDDFRREFLSNTCRNTRRPPDEAWYGKNMNALLDAVHDVQRDVTLNDVEVMMKTWYAKMYVNRQKRAYE